MHRKRKGSLGWERVRPSDAGGHHKGGQWGGGKGVSRVHGRRTPEICIIKVVGPGGEASVLEEGGKN